MAALLPWRRRVTAVAASVTLLIEYAGATVSADPGLNFTADDECSVFDGADRDHCAFRALQLKATSIEKAAEGSSCATLEAPANNVCRSVVNWVFSGGGKYNNDAPSWFRDMRTIAGVDYRSASREDFQRLYFCAPPGGKTCGTPPCSCSKPPCNTCVANQARKKACSTDENSIACKPPKGPLDYKGMTWPTITVNGEQEKHIFAIGDWGGMDGSLNPIEGRPHVVAYKWGARPGPSVFPRTRWDLNHYEQLCSHKQFIACFNSRGDGPDCPESCGYVKDVDDQPQQLVANAVKDRAAISAPDYFLNVGDNFYWGGIEKNCGTPMDEISFTAHHQFDQIYESVYQADALQGKPWLSVLGNHDWGGRVFNNGWDQQIAYTWASERWVMPAPYYMTTADYPDQGFSIDFFMADSNFVDAKEPSEDSEHNLCGQKHNSPQANCGHVQGPESIESCPAYFQKLWQEQKVWLKAKLSASKATWQVMVTHFPCGEDGENQGFYRTLHQQYGLDLLVTGHRHDQELWLPDMHHKNHMGGLTCFVTGGGGGITSEATPNENITKDWYGEAQYGFYDLTVTKSYIKIESINWDGRVMQTATIGAAPQSVQTRSVPPVAAVHSAPKAASVPTQPVQEGGDADISPTEAATTTEESRRRRRRRRRRHQSHEK